MKFMVIVYPGNKDAKTYEETGKMPPDEAMMKMGKFNEELVNAGVMVAAEGLRPSSQGARLNFQDGKPSVTKGPFDAENRLVGGFWIWNVKSEEEALNWAKQAPMEDGDTLELRRIASAEDFSPGIQEEIKKKRA
jgi:hypothetical protein